MYDERHVHTTQESKLIWCLYYFNTWYRVLQVGTEQSIDGSQLYPNSPLPMPPAKPIQLDIHSAEPSYELIDYYVYSKWYYMIQLQILRHEVMTRILSAQSFVKQESPFTQDDMSMMQHKLEEFYNNLPEEWRNPDVENIALCSDSAAHLDHKAHYYHLDIHEFAMFCILTVRVYYHINKILLYQAFLPSDYSTTSAFSLDCLQKCTDAAYSITQTLDIMVKHSHDCNIPLMGLLFANMVYTKLLNYTDGQYKEFAIRCLEQSINISKLSKAYLYDFDMARHIVSIMERDLYNVRKG